MPSNTTIALTVCGGGGHRRLSQPLVVGDACRSAYSTSSSRSTYQEFLVQEVGRS